MFTFGFLSSFFLTEQLCIMHDSPMVEHQSQSNWGVPGDS